LATERAFVTVNTVHKAEGSTILGIVEEIAKIHYEGLIEEFKAIGIDADISRNHLESMWELYSDNIIATHKKKGKVVGFLGLWKGKPMIYVDSKYQRQGIGSELLNKVYAGVVWVMEGNTKAENFYRKHGFKPVSARETSKLGHSIIETKWVRNAVQEEEKA